MSSVDTEDTEEKLFEFLKQWPFMLSAFHSLVKRLQRRYDHHLISISRKKKNVKRKTRKQESSRFAQDRDGN